MTRFDRACDEFKAACATAAHWQDYFGAGYRTRIDAAFEDVKKAYVAVVAADDEGLGDGDALAVAALNAVVHVMDWGKLECGTPQSAELIAAISKYMADTGFDPYRYVSDQKKAAKS